MRKEIEFITLKVSIEKAPLLLKMLEIEHDKTIKAIDCNLTKRDFKIHKAMEEHYDMESFLIHDIKKELKDYQSKTKE